MTLMLSNVVRQPKPKMVEVVVNCVCQQVLFGAQSTSTRCWNDDSGLPVKQPDRIALGERPVGDGFIHGYHRRFNIVAASVSTKLMDGKFA